MKQSKTKEFKLSTNPDLASATPSFEIRKIFLDTEATWLLFKVTVPSGQSVLLEVTKTGLAEFYPDSEAISEGYVLIDSNISTNISGVKKYSVGIDALDGDTSIQTDITITIGGVLYYTLSKEHSNPPTT